jgi:hypothetical protein
MILRSTIEQYTARPNSASARSAMPTNLLWNAARSPGPRLKHDNRGGDQVGMGQRHVYE